MGFVSLTRYRNWIQNWKFSSPYGRKFLLRRGVTGSFLLSVLKPLDSELLPQSLTLIDLVIPHSVEDTQKVPQLFSRACQKYYFIFILLLPSSIQPHIHAYYITLTIWIKFNKLDKLSYLTLVSQIKDFIISQTISWTRQCRLTRFKNFCL